MSKEIGKLDSTTPREKKQTAQPGRNPRRTENPSAGFPRRPLDCRGRAARMEDCRRAKTASTEDSMKKTAKGGSRKELRIRRAKRADAPQIAVLAGQLGYPATPSQMRQRLLGIKPASRH